MGFGGHVQDMINRMKVNREQRPSNKKQFKGANRETHYVGENGKESLSFKTLPENELHEVKKQIRERANKKNKQELIALGVIIMLGLITILLVL